MSDTNTEVTDVRALASDEVDRVAGAEIVTGIIVGLATSLIYDWLKAPGKKSIPEFLGHLKT